MLKNTLLLFTILLYTGCAERGYKLSSNRMTHTVTAESSVDLSNTAIQTKTELRKMQEAIEKEQTKQSTVKAEETITEVKTREKALREKKLAEKKLRDQEKMDEAILNRKAKDLDNETLALKKQEEAARKSKFLEDERLKIDQAQKANELEALKAKNKDAEAKALELKMAQEAQDAKRIQALENEKIQKAQADLAAKKLLASQQAEALRQAQIEEKKLMEAKKSAKAKKLKLQEERERELNTAKSTLASTEPLKFKLINKIYHKFGSSEVHGHVIYLDPSGQEIRLAGSKVYLLPISATLNNWYENYYLKNQTNPNSNGTVANYLNSTYLNLEKNFEFYGVAEGSYYVIIESQYPSNMAKNEKVYIAKRIEVGKLKKIMAVFSKKL